jgi:DNA-binding NarL/FixJ family response regulator
MKSKIKIIIVDDNPIFLEGITTFLNKENVYEILACFNSGDILLDHINNYNPDLVLLDIEMSGLNGIETARRLNWFRTEVKLIAITMYQDGVYLKQLIEAGFHGFVNKNNVYEKLTHVITSVLRNEFAFPKIRFM